MNLGTEEIKNINKICDKIHSNFKDNKSRNYHYLEKICKDNNIMIDDYLYNQGYKDYNEYLDDIRFVPIKELRIYEITQKIPLFIQEYLDHPIENLKDEEYLKQHFCDSFNELVYADNEICYYDCHDGGYLYIDTLEAMGFEDDEFSLQKGQVLFVNELAINNIFVDDNKSLFNEIKKKYNTYNCIKENCYISDSFKKEIEEIDNERFKDLRQLTQCVDFIKLKETFSDEILQEIEKVLEDYHFYQSLYDDGDIDIIDQYTRNYGNRNVIDWYEGIISTEEFVETYLINKLDNMEI